MQVTGLKLRYDYIIPYQEVDANRRLRLYTLENYLLIVAGRAADDQGFGIQYLYPQGLTWVIIRLNLEMTYMPTHGDRIVFETWVEQNNHMLSTRNFNIYKDNQLIGCASSVWAVLDLNKREIVNVFDQAPFQNCIDNDRINLPRPQRLTPITEPTYTHQHTIQYSDVDYNNHCNSCKYLEIMLDTYTPTFLTKPLSLSINYSKEAHLSDTITTAVLDTQDSVQYQQKDAKGLTCCSARIAKLKNIDC